MLQRPTLKRQRSSSTSPSVSEHVEKKTARRPRTLTKTVAAIRNATISRHYHPPAPIVLPPEIIDLTNEIEEEDEVEDAIAGQDDRLISFRSKNGKAPPVDNVDTAKGRCRRTQWPGVVLKSQEYRTGDAVLVKLRGGKLGRGLITSIFELEDISTGRKDYKVHAHWLRESCVGQKGELFLKDRCCQDIHLRHVLEKLPFTLLPISTDGLETSFCRFVHAPRLTWRDPEFSDPSHCDSCKQNRKALEKTLVHHKAKEFRYHDEVYHENDCVVLDSGASGKPDDIVQIKSLPRKEGKTESRDYKFRVVKMERYSDRPVQPGEPVDWYHLYSSDQVIQVTADKIRRRCPVAPDQDSAKAQSTNLPFWCDTQEVTLKYDAETNTRECKSEPYDLPLCKRCTATQKRRDERERTALENIRLPAMDLYSGAGGTVTGASKYFQVKAAVDYDPVACETLRMNHPDTEVYCSSVDRLHLRELRQLSKKPIQEHRDREERILPMLPKRGDITILTACPPCEVCPSEPPILVEDSQGHSGANHHKSADDERNDELFTCLSELDRLQADFFVFENVPGIKNSRSDGSFVDQDATNNFAQLAITVLLAIGYQCRLAIMDCRSYGSPQHRVRCFILAARQGVKLPDFPQPTHANPLPRSTTFGLDEYAAQKFYVEEGTPGTGPLPAITAEDAISDLPAFCFAGIKCTAMKAKAATVPVVLATRLYADEKGAVGYTTPEPYRCAPLNAFQASKRKQETVCRDQYTPYATDGVVDMIKTAHRVHPSELQGSKRRGDPRAGFNTLLTDSRPGGKATAQIHWNQHRTYTVAERKRAQGLPDSYWLSGHVDDQDKQLGNMVNVDIAEAIYRQIVRQSILPWYRKRGLNGQEDVAAEWRKDHRIPPFHPPKI